MESGKSGIVLLLNFRSNKKDLPGTLQDFCVSEVCGLSQVVNQHKPNGIKIEEVREKTGGNCMSRELHFFKCSLINIEWI